MRQQAAAGLGAAIHRLGQRALAGTKARMREGQPLQRPVAPRAVQQLGVCPVQKALAQRLKKGLQISRRAVLGQRRCGLLAAHIKVHQRHGDGRQGQLLAQQMAIHLGLGPVQQPVVGGLARQITAKGFDLVQPLGIGVVAVGAAPHLQVLILARQRQLSLVTQPALRGHGLVAGNALPGAGRRREAQVKIALLGRKLAE